MCPFATIRDDNFTLESLTLDTLLNVSTAQNQFEKQTLKDLICTNPFIFDDFRWRSCLNPKPIGLDRLKILNGSIENALSSLLDSGESYSVLKSLLSLLETGFKPSMYFSHFIYLASDLLSKTLVALLKQKSVTNKQSSLFIELMNQLSKEDSCHYESWFSSESLIPTEIVQFQSKLSGKVKRKNNFVVLLDVFVAEEQNEWLYLLLIGLVNHAKETFMSSIQSTKMKGKFEYLFQLLGLDIFFPNAYNFIPIVRCLLDSVGETENITVFIQLKVDLLHELLSIFISYAVHHSWSFLVDFAEEVSVLLRTATVNAVYNFCNSCVMIPSFNIIVIRKLFEKRFTVRGNAGLRHSHEGWFSLKVIEHAYLSAEIAQTPKKSTDTTAESSLLELMKKLLLESFLETRRVNSLIYLDETEQQIILNSPFINYKKE